MCTWQAASCGTAGGATPTPTRFPNRSSTCSPRYASGSSRPGSCSNVTASTPPDRELAAELATIRAILAGSGVRPGG
jgi:hypothetical protein